MSDHDFDENTANEATGFSGFGGHPLTVNVQSDGAAAVSAIESMETGNYEIAANLLSLGIEDAEQFVAAASIPEVKEELASALGLKKQRFQSLLQSVESLLPADRTELVSTPAPKEFGLGVLAPPPEMIESAEMSAMSSEAASAVSLPGAVNLIPYMPPIRNQGPRGTCVAFSLTALNEYILRRQNVIQNLSEQHLYYETKLIDGSPTGCGTWQVKAVIALLNRGQCREQVWPYNPNLPCNNHGPLPAQARPDGLHYRRSTIAVPARNVTAYKNHMALQRPVTLSIPVYNSWYQSAETKRSGRITMRIGNEPSVGGHAVCLVGYQDSANSPGGGYFIVRNSWNTTWAYNSPYGAGYGTIPYQYITNEAWEAFTSSFAAAPLGDDDANNGETSDEKETVTIQVGSNVKITISAE